MKRINASRKYVIAALAPLLLWGTNALMTWSVTRRGLALLILAEAAAGGVWVAPNEPLQMFALIVLIGVGVVSLTIAGAVVWAIIVPEKNIPEDDPLA